MPSDQDLWGELVQYEHPDWQLLYEIVGLELADWFMWMNEFELEDGVRAHAYKHIYMRRYFLLAADGRALRYLSRGRYREIDRLSAIEHVFECWEDCTTDAQDIAELRAGLLKARRRAAACTARERSRPPRRPAPDRQGS